MLSILFSLSSEQFWENKTKQKDKTRYSQQAEKTVLKYLENKQWELEIRGRIEIIPRN